MVVIYLKSNSILSDKSNIHINFNSPTFVSKISLISAQITHNFMNVSEPIDILIGTKVFTIPIGHYNANQFSDVLNLYFKKFGVFVFFNKVSLKYTFTGSYPYIVNFGLLGYMIGFENNKDYTFVQASMGGEPIKDKFLLLSINNCDVTNGLKNIYLHSNLIPENFKVVGDNTAVESGIITNIPINCNFGGKINFEPIPPFYRYFNFLKKNPPI